MEKLNLVKDGVMRLPPGFRFHPTDEELVVQYLKRKVLNCPLPASIIPDVEVCKSDPWDLPGDAEKERFFFSTREIKYPNGNRSNRATQSGYWKATGLDKQITGIRPNQIVGMKKTLVFYQGKPPTGSRTDWIMHEYRLANPPRPDPKNPTQGSEKWVLCRIFLKKRGGNNKEEEKETTEVKNVKPIEIKNVKPIEIKNVKPIEIKNVKPKPVFYDFLAGGKVITEDLNLAPASSSSGSSGVTHEHGHEENSNDRDQVSALGGKSGYKP